MNQPAQDSVSAAKKSLLRRLAPWLFMLLILGLLFKKVGLSDVFEELQKINYLPVALISIVFVLGVTALDAFSQYLAFNWFNCKVSFQETLMGRGALWLGAALTYALGQAGMAWYIHRRKQVPLGETTSTVVYLFFMDIYGMLLVSAIGLCLLWPNLQLNAILASMNELAGREIPFYNRIQYFLSSERLSATALLILILVWMPFFVIPLLFRSEKLQSAFPFLLQSRLVQTFRKNTFPKMFSILLAKALLCLYQMLMTLAVFYACDIAIPWRQVLAFMPLSILISGLPVTPLRIGTTQWGWVIFFAHTADVSVLVAFSFAWQVILNIVRLSVGAAFLPFVRKDLF